MAPVKKITKKKKKSNPFADEEDDLLELKESEEDPKGERNAQGQRVEGKLSPRYSKPRNQASTLEFLYKLVKGGQLDLDPEYQRDVVWTDKKQSDLIDSMLNNISIPTIILAEKTTDDGDKYTCVDGKQRITSIVRFMDGEIPTKGADNCAVWYTSESRRKRVFSSRRQRDFSVLAINVAFYCDLSIEQERGIFYRVQNGVPLPPAVSMAAWNSPHADAVRGLQRRVVEIFADLDTHEELKGVHGKDFFVVAQALFLIRYGIQKEPTIAKVETMVKSTQDVPLKARSGADSAFAMLHFMANHPRYRDSLADLTPAMEIPVATVFLLTFQHLPFWLLAELLQQLLTIVRGAKKATSKINAEITTLLNDFIRSVPKLVQLHPDYRSGDKAASVEMTEPLQSKVVAEVELEQFPATAVAEIKPKDVLEDVEGQTEKEESKEVDWRDLMRNAPRKAQRKALARIHDYHEKEATDDRNEKMEEPPDGGFRPAKRTKRSISTDTPDDPVLSAPPASATRTTKRMLDEGNVVYTTRSVRQKTENKPSPSSTPSLTSARPVAVVAPAPAPTASKPVIKGEPSCSSTTPRNEDLPGNIRELSKRPVSSALAAPAIPNDANRASTPPRRQYAKPAKAHLPVLQSAGEDTPCKEPISQHQSSASACYSQPVQIRRSADVDKAQAEVTARTVSKMLYGDSSAKRSPVASTSALRDPRIPSSIVENQYSMSSVESNATAPATSSTFDLRPTSESRQYPHFNRDGKLAQASSSPVKNLPTGLNDRQDIRRLWRETDSYRPEPERHWDRDRRGSGSSELQHHLSLPGRRTSSYSETYRR